MNVLSRWDVEHHRLVANTVGVVVGWIGLPRDFVWAMRTVRWSGDFGHYMHTFPIFE